LRKSATELVPAHLVKHNMEERGRETKAVANAAIEMRETALHFFTSIENKIFFFNEGLLRLVKAFKHHLVRSSSEENLIEILQMSIVVCLVTLLLQI